MRESTIEKKVCDHAKQLGWLTYKFASPSCRGVPDRMFIRSGKVIFIEFKSEGKKLSKLQEFIRGEIQSRGGTYLVVDNVKDGYKTIDQMG